MKPALFLFVCCLPAASPSHAQTADLYVPPGGKLFFANDNEAAVFGNMQVDGTVGQETGSVLYFYGQSWVNGNAAVFHDETGTGMTPDSGGIIAFRQPHPLYGSLGVQTLDGGYNALDYSGPSLPSVQLENTSGLILLNSHAAIRNELRFIEGHVYLNGNDLAIGSSGAPGHITGYDAGHFVVTGGGRTGGSLAMLTTSFPGNDTVIFPIGTDEQEYTPAAVRNTGNKTGHFKARVFDGVYDAGFSGDDISARSVKKTWQIASSGEPFQADIFLQHNLPDEGPLFHANRQESFVSRLADQQWDTSDISGPPLEPGWMTTGLPITGAGINDRSFVLQAGSTHLFTKMTRLPVPQQCVAKFTYFQVWKEGTFRTRLSWGVLARAGIISYNVEKRIGPDGAWNVVAQIPSANMFDYSWMDEDVQYNESSYYRIRLNCHTGEHLYSDMRLTMPEEVAIVFPNPTLGKFTLSVAFPERVSAAVLNDAAGKKILTRKITKQHTEFDISHVAAGVYLISVYSDKKEHLATVRLLKTN